MKAQLLGVILDELRKDPVRGSAALAALGVRPGVVDRLKMLDCEMLPAMAEGALIGITLDFEAIARIHTSDELLAELLRHGATNDIIIELLGLTVRAISAQRAAMGIPSKPGRPTAMDDKSTTLAEEAWRMAEHLPKAPRLLAVHEKLPMWPLSSLYAVLRGK
jgi:hypothetical protein